MGFSQVKLASESNVSLPTIQNIEAGKANPSVDILEKLLGALGLELKLTPIEFDIDKAIALGVPLTSITEKPSLIPITDRTLKYECRKWHHAFENHVLNEREEMALIGFLMAIKDHYPEFYRNEVSCPLFEKKLKENRTLGKVIKLRRIALANVSRYL